MTLPSQAKVNVHAIKTLKTLDYRYMRLIISSCLADRYMSFSVRLCSHDISGNGGSLPAVHYHFYSNSYFTGAYMTDSAHNQIINKTLKCAEKCLIMSMGMCAVRNCLTSMEGGSSVSTM